MRLEQSLCLAPFVEVGYAGVCFVIAEVGCAAAGCAAVGFAGADYVGADCVAVYHVSVEVDYAVVYFEAVVGCYFELCFVVDDCWLALPSCVEQRWFYVARTLIHNVMCHHDQSLVRMMSKMNVMGLMNEYHVDL